MRWKRTKGRICASPNNSCSKTIPSEWFIAEWGKRNSDKWLLACSAALINGNAFIICSIMDWEFLMFLKSLHRQRQREIFKIYDVLNVFMGRDVVSYWVSLTYLNILSSPFPFIRFMQHHKSNKLITKCIKILIITKWNEESNCISVVANSLLNYTTSSHCLNFEEYIKRCFHWDWMRRVRKLFTFSLRSLIYSL